TVVSLGRTERAHEQRPGFAQCTNLVTGGDGSDGLLEHLGSHLVDYLDAHDVALIGVYRCEHAAQVGGRTQAPDSVIQRCCLSLVEYVPFVRETNAGELSCVQHKLPHRITESC